MADAQKDTIYIDIDDEITAIIDKLQNSASKLVVLVLPKRATALQSIVNMKLLKRASEQANKNLVLVSTESSLLPLAGAVGVHVAKTPTSRPEIPPSPSAAASREDDVINLDDEPAAPLTADNAGDRPVGDLAAASTMPRPGKPTADSGVETLELDNTEAPAAATAARAASKSPKPKKDKKLKVPDFNRFRMLLLLGGALLLALIIFGYFAIAVLPKATINIKTNASNVNTDVDFTLSTSANSFNESSKTVPAERVQVQKTLTGTSNASGQKNNGERATGNVTFTSPCANGVQTIPAGTGLSTGGQTYITQRSVTMNNASGGGGNCRFSGSTGITAQNGGASGNTSNDARFSVSRSSSGAYDPGTITATGSANGGTDDIQTVVSQSDIDSAKAKIAANADNSVRDELKDQLEDQNLYAITSTFVAGEPATTSSSKAGDEASNVTVTQVITYTMLGANLENIKTLVNNDITGQIDAENQSILNQGITEGSFKQNSTNANGAIVNIQTTAVVGPALNTDQIAEQAAGKKGGEIKSDVSAYTGVTDVEVKMSPFWVSKAPKKTDKITVTIAKPTNTANDN